MFRCFGVFRCSRVFRCSGVFRCSSVPGCSGVPGFSTCRWTLLIRTRLFGIPHYFELETISLGFAPQLFTIGYFKLPLFQTIFSLPREFKMARFNYSFVRLAATPVHWPHLVCAVQIHLATRSLVLVVISGIGDTKSPCSQAPPFSKHLDKGFHPRMVPASRVAMDTSLQHMALAHCKPSRHQFPSL